MLIDTLNPDSQAASRLISLSDAYMASLYPAESNHMMNQQELKSPDTHFIGVHCDKEVIGCGAVKSVKEDVHYGEIKRVFVPVEHRGKGLSKLIMQALEDHLRSMNIAVARLETGARQPEAIQLYKKLGYRECGPFGKYTHDPLSVFMEKELAS
ncbi:GNAT family N-acetyltransferase [Halomonas sp. ML-15]|uniref:GNAT family N-acetyltransferase n=1 Tax=Halomonas sp. ML-15 TaxID=2773305 RepID=UPI00174653F4|nr:GNAT family N-acetyltransferase [Halomonas sp. ML-15]MBD3897286.1 GNAT family N-acetyltransferase [Halomonas sp. ML-15]